MKIRNGFVSNSSSSSFVLGLKKFPKTVEEAEQIILDAGIFHHIREIDGQKYTAGYHSVIATRELAQRFLETITQISLQQAQERFEEGGWFVHSVYETDDKRSSYRAFYEQTEKLIEQGGCVVQGQWGSETGGDIDCTLQNILQCYAPSIKEPQ